MMSHILLWGMNSYGKYDGRCRTQGRQEIWSKVIFQQGKSGKTVAERRNALRGLAMQVHFHGERL